MQKDIRKIEKEVEQLELEKKNKAFKPSLSCHLCGQTLKDDEIRLHARTHQMTETEFHVDQESHEMTPGPPMDLNFF